jgi:hypothetical protein
MLRPFIDSPTAGSNTLQVLTTQAKVRALQSAVRAWMYRGDGKRCMLFRIQSGFIRPWRPPMDIDCEMASSYKCTHVLLYFFCLRCSRKGQEEESLSTQKSSSFYQLCQKPALLLQISLREENRSSVSVVRA